MAVEKPQNPEQVQEIVAASLAAKSPLEIKGAGTKRGWGQPVQAERTLDMSGLSGITLYEPEELVLTAWAGTPMAEIVSALSEKNQRLAFEPPDYGPLFGGASGSGTLGGAIACNLSGPRRLQAGAARDHLLGFKAVSGHGEIFKSGGRVVKNVTGFDLSKLISGSFGTLAVMTEVTVKVLPQPEKTRTVLIFGLENPQRACEAMSAALQSPLDISGAAHLPQRIAARSEVGYVADAKASVTALRLEGPGPSVEARTSSLRALLAEYGETEELHSSNSGALWREVGDVASLVPDESFSLWRLSVPPMDGGAIGDGCLMDWAGGLIWWTGETAPMLEGGGHATQLRGPSAEDSSGSAFQPLPSGVAALSARIKDSFDPAHILNPGRMYPAL